MAVFTKPRNVELSIVQHIETDVNNNWTGVSVVKAFLSAYSARLPVICVRMLDIDTFRREIGGNALRQQYTIVVDIFAKSDGQRIDLADFIVNSVKDGFVYYEYSKNSGDNETLVATENGRIVFLRFLSNRRIEFNDDTSEHDKFRQSISFTVEKVSQ